ncbi:protein of unknown function [Pararobbsia alpina]
MTASPGRRASVLISRRGSLSDHANGEDHFVKGLFGLLTYSALPATVSPRNLECARPWALILGIAVQEWIWNWQRNEGKRMLEPSCVHL